MCPALYNGFGIVREVELSKIYKPHVTCRIGSSNGLAFKVAKDVAPSREQ